MKIGVVVDRPEPVKGFDFTFYYVKQVDGKINKAANGVHNIISCFGDNRTSRERPEWIAISEYGKATKDNKKHRFCWDWICPSVEEYKKFLIDLIKEVSKADVAGIHLDCVRFPRQEYCVCQRCKRSYERSGLEWMEWRAEVINEFVKESSKFVKGSFSISLYPDPCFVKERFGQDIHSLARYVDFFVIPIYDLIYSTTYWVEDLAYCFRKQLKKPFYVELYAGYPKPPIENLLKAVAIASNYADGVILAAYDLRLIKEVQEKLMKEDKLHRYLKEHEHESVLSIIERWKESLLGEV